MVQNAPALQSRDSRQGYAKAADRFRSQWEREFATDPDEKDFGRRSQSEFFGKVGEDLKWGDLAEAIAKSTFAVRNVELLRDLAKLVHAAVGALVVLIDNLWGTTLEVQAVLAELFHSSIDRAEAETARHVGRARLRCLRREKRDVRC